MSDIRLITLDPGHFHAALVQKSPLPHVSRRVHIHAPLGPDLLAHLQRIAGFNLRANQPTDWELEVHASPDYLERFKTEPAGQVVVLAGRNRRKIDYIEAAVAAGHHVLADKPWIIASQDLPRLRGVLDQADTRGLVAYDIMTERFEITSILQRLLVQDREVFGDLDTGSEADPAVVMKSVHYLKKQVAGAPLRRPAWFFDIQQQGEGLNDVGTHLVDLVMWILFPDQSIDVEKDIRILRARRWPTMLTPLDFQGITGETGFPDFLTEARKQQRLDYYCNNQVGYTLRGIHVRLDAIWDLQSEQDAGDSHLAVFQGTRARIEIRQEQEEQYIPELYVMPRQSADRPALAAALAARVAAWQDHYPGVAVAEQASRFWLKIPDRYRVGHEAHFAEVARQFLQYRQHPQSLPAWEKANMLAKYHVTTLGVDRARRP